LKGIARESDTPVSQMQQIIMELPQQTFHWISPPFIRCRVNPQIVVHHYTGSGLKTIKTFPCTGDAALGHGTYSTIESNFTAAIKQTALHKHQVTND